MVFRPRRAPISTSQIAQDVLAQTETIYQDVQNNATQAYNNDKDY